MTLLELLHLMRKRIKLIVLLPLIFAIATAAFKYLALPNVYTATISMYVAIQERRQHHGVINVTL